MPVGNIGQPVSRFDLKNPENIHARIVPLLTRTGNKDAQTKTAGMPAARYKQFKLLAIAEWFFRGLAAATK